MLKLIKLKHHAYFGGQNDMITIW